MTSMSCKIFELTTRSYDTALRMPCSDSYKLKMALFATFLSYYQRRNLPSFDASAIYTRGLDTAYWRSKLIIVTFKKDKPAVNT